jgi:hypothetical protein
VPAGASVTEHEAAIIRSPYREGTGEERAWSQAMRLGRHPAVPRFSVDFRSVIYAAAGSGSGSGSRSGSASASGSSPTSSASSPEIPRAFSTASAIVPTM